MPVAGNRATAAGALQRVRVEGISKSFGSVRAVDDVSFTVEPGELFSLLGPSGCGKTTLLRILAGLEAPDAGRVWIDDQDVTELPPHRRPVNMMFQRYALFPHLSVFDNIAFGLREARQTRTVIRERVQALVSLTDLTGLERRKPHQLSGGQQQRVALARALARQPKLLLLDEPLAALDKRLRDATALELKRLQRQTDSTFIMVTHDQDEAMTLSHRVAVMFDGRIAQLAAPHEIYDQPRNRAVAEFIGDINLIDGHLLEVHGGHATFQSAGFGTFTVRMRAGDFQAGEQLALGLRPERLTLLPSPAENNGIEASVEAVAYHGDVSVFHLRTAAGRKLLAKVANTGGRVHAVADATVFASFDQGDGILLRP